MKEGFLSDRAAHLSRPTFGKYVLLRKLASGGMGEIFLAKQRGPSGFEKLLVIKRILSHHLDKRDYLDMFFSEAKLVARLNHHNIIQIHEMGEIDGDHYIAMEYVRGKSLRDVIDRSAAEGRPMPVAHVVELGIRLCEGLGYAHQARDIRGRPMNIVHRDINPHNILIAYAGDLKLIDFGIAKSEMTSVHTATGTIKGKFVYMSPEQSAADPLDKRSDIFSVGIVLYEMLALENPFVRQNVVLSLEAIQRQAVPPLSDRRQDASALDPVLQRALEKAPEGRFQSAIEMRDALRVLLRGGAVPRPPMELGAFLRSLFAKDIAAEDRLLAEAEEASRSIPVAPVAPSSLVAGNTGEVVPTATPGVRPYQDDEPTLSGAPEPHSDRSQPSNQPISARSFRRLTGEVGARDPRSASAVEPLAPPLEQRSSGGVVPRRVLAENAPEAAFFEPSPVPSRMGSISATLDASELGREPKPPRVAPSELLVYALVFLALFVPSYFGMRAIMGDDKDIALLSVDSEEVEDEEPPSESADGRAEESQIPALLEPPEEVPPPSLQPPQTEGHTNGTVAQAPAEKEVAQKREGPPSSSSRPDPREAPVEIGVRAESPESEGVQADASVARGKVRIFATSGASATADGRILGRTPRDYVVRRDRGNIVVTAGEGLGYTVTLDYTVADDRQGLSIRVASAPWTIVQHKGISLGRTPQGPVPPASSHQFTLVRPGQGEPFVVKVAWSPR